MKELILRLKMPLNQFWKRFRLWMIAISAFSATVTEVLQPMMGNQFIPEPWNNWLQHAYMFALFGAAIASLTVHNTEELKEAKNSNKK